VAQQEAEEEKDEQVSNASTAFFADHLADTDGAILEDLKNVLRQHHSAHPRSQQRELGPSQIGHPCARHLISALIEQKPINPAFDPLPSYIGVAVHKHIEDAVALANSKLQEQGKPERWISEHKLHMGYGVSGTADLFDLNTKTVIDLKVPGTSKMTAYRKGGPSETYRIQAHLYGYGYTREGIEVDRVAIWFLPRAGSLASSFLWSEPYDESVALQTLSRYEDLLLLADELQVEHNPERLALIPKENSQCAFCPWYSKNSTDNPAACNGDNYEPAHRDRR
jgi:hypothetical protein